MIDDQSKYTAIFKDLADPTKAKVRLSFDKKSVYRAEVINKLISEGYKISYFQTSSLGWFKKTIEVVMEKVK